MEGRFGPEPADRQGTKGTERRVPVLVTSQGKQPHAWAHAESDQGVVEAEVARASVADGEWRSETRKGEMSIKNE